MAAYSATGAAANLVSAIHSVVNGISDTEKRCAKLNHTGRLRRHLCIAEQVMVVYPDDRDEQVADRVAQPRWPQR